MAPKIAKYNWVTKLNEKTGEIYKTKELKFLPLEKIDEKTPFKEQIILIPCGKCAGCKIDKANDWATRAYLESQKWPVNCFLTLTYSNDYIPTKRTLKKADLQKFWKKLRKTQKEPIRYIACGEYGPKTLRPHYHACVFNYRPTDLKEYKKNIVGDTLYTSEELNKLWGKGYVIVGNITYESAAYVARYVLKKAYGATNELHLKAGREPEFTAASRRGGIGIYSFQDKKEWEEIKKDNGVYIQTKNGPKLKKIPQFLKQKWKDLDDREEYFKHQNEEEKRNKENIKKILKNTSKNIYQYQKQQAETLTEKIKRLDKRGNTE